MPIHDHQPAFRGRAFFWGGIVLGVLLVAALLTQGFGLWRAAPRADDTPAFSIRQGGKIVVPEGSPLRSRLTVAAAAANAVNAKLFLPAVVEADPARSASVIPQLSGKVIDLKVHLGDRVAKGQALVVMDSADLAQAYDDFDKAQDAARLTQKNLGRQTEQSKIGVASDKDLDQAKSDNAQAEAELERTRQHLNVLGAATESHGHARLLVVRAPVAGSITSFECDARCNGQRSNRSADDHRRLEHRVDHGDGCREGSGRHLQGSGCRGQPACLSRKNPARQGSFRQRCHRCRLAPRQDPYRFRESRTMR